MINIGYAFPSPCITLLHIIVNVTRGIAKEKTEPPYPAMTWEDTFGNLKALDTWREKVNYKLPQDEI